MKKVAESCPGTTTNLQAGNTSQTGTNVLDRTVMNTPDNETIIRGTSLPFIRSCLGDDLVDQALAAGAGRTAGTLHRPACAWLHTGERRG